MPNVQLFSIMAKPVPPFTELSTNSMPHLGNPAIAMPARSLLHILESRGGISGEIAGIYIIADTSGSGVRVWPESESDVQV